MALVIALVVEISPPHELAALATAVVPVLGVVALPIVVSRARAERDSDLAWFGAGLAVSVGAAALQTLSFPGVLGAGGPLHTGASGNALLYLAMHAAMAVGVLMAALGVPGRYRGWFVAAGLLLVLVSALGVLPLPRLVLAGGRYSSALIAAQLLVAWLIAVAAVVWVRRSGPSVTALRGWAGVALSLSGYDVLLSAISGQRYSSVWWASLALRVATFAVLAAGAGAGVLAQLRRLEQYTDRELDRSDERLRGSMAVTNRLLDSAERFSRASHQRGRRRGPGRHRARGDRSRPGLRHHRRSGLGSLPRGGEQRVRRREPPPADAAVVAGGRDPRRGGAAHGPTGLLHARPPSGRRLPRARPAARARVDRVDRRAPAHRRGRGGRAAGGLRPGAHLRRRGA